MTRLSSQRKVSWYLYLPPPTNRPVRFEPRRVEQPVSFPMPAGKEITRFTSKPSSVIRSRRTKAAADWYNNWGFLANKPQPR